MSQIRYLLLALSLAFSAPAAALDEPTTPPALKGSADVPYPNGGSGDAVVLLELVVDQNGSVTEATVLEGAEPFATQASDAVRAFRFAPARRGDNPVSSRIRMRVEFHPPAPPAENPGPREAPSAASTSTEAPSAASTSTEAPSAASTSTEAPSAASTSTEAPPATSTAPAPAAEEPAQEVTVLGERREIGERRMSAAEVRLLPGAFGDAFRAIEALPGVTPALSGIPYFFVRGGPPNNNGYFLDGVRVPLLFHVAFGPSVVHPGLIERVEFHPGAANARYGGVAGAIVTGELRPPQTKARGEANLRLVDAGALLEAPFADGRGNALVAGRFGYPGPIVSAFSDITLGYWDYQARFGVRVGERGNVSVFAFGSHDYLAHREQNREVEDMVSDFHRLDLRYDHALRDGGMRVAATLGHDRQGSDPTYLKNRSAALRFQFDQRVSSALRVRAGSEARLEVYSIEEGVPADPEEPLVPSNAKPAPTNFAPAAYADLVWRVAPRIELIPGARVTLFHSLRERATDDRTLVRTSVLAADPRLSARFVLLPGLAWLSSFGVQHQYPVLRVGGLPALIAAGAGFPRGNSRLQETLHATQGVEAHLPADITLSLTGFYSRSRGLTDLTAMCFQIEPPEVPPGQGPPASNPHYCPSNAPVKGHAYGLEVLLRRALSERLSGMLSYTLSRSVREAHFVRLDGTEAVATVPSEFDRTHVLNAILSYDLGRNWRAGSRLVLYSGVPYSKLSGNVPQPPYNHYRDPLFARLDVRLEKRWLLGSDRSIAFVVEGQNVTLSKDANTLGMDCRGDITPDGYTTQCQRGKVGPLTIPSIGVEAFF
ncbi:MAG: TonB-dependent receptor domain-containing protein [Myxococcota bacterium]